MYEAITHDKPIYENRSLDIYASEFPHSCLNCESHLHPHVEMFYLVSGRVLASVDFKQYEVSQGEALIVFPNQVHKFTSLEKNERSLLFIIHPNVTPEYAELFSAFRPADPVIRGISENSALHKLFFSLSESANSTDARYHSLRTKGLALSLCGALLKHEL